LWGIGAAACYQLFMRSRQWLTAVIVGAAVLSHWLLDFLVHRPVLPLYGDTFKVGLGLYRLPGAALILEIGLLFGGMYFYMKKTKPLGRAGRYGMVLFSLLMLALLAFVSFGPPLQPINAAASAALITWLILAAIAGYIERMRV
jgi:hypothetical protein